MRKKLLAILISLLLIIIIASYLLLTTQTGLSISLKLARACLPGKLQVLEAKGSLIGPLSIQELNYQSKSLTLTINSLTLSWAPGTLLTGRLTINSLSVSKLFIHYWPATNSSAKSTSFKLPLLFDLNNIDLNILSIQKANQPITKIQSLQLVSAYSLGTHLSIKQLTLIKNPYTLTLQGETTLAQPFTTHLSGMLMNNTKNFKPVLLDYTFINTDSKVQFVIQAEAPFVAELKADINQPAELGSINITGFWQHLIWPLSPTSSLNSIKGSLVIHGTLKAYGIKLETRLAGTNIPDTELSLQGQGNNTSITTHSLAKLLDGAITATGSVHWSPLQGQLTLQGKNLNLNKEWPVYPSKLNFNALIEQSSLNQQTNVLIKLLNVQGDLNHQTLQGHGLINKSENNWLFNPLSLSVGNNLFLLQGQVGQTSQLNWHLQIKSLHQLMTKATGSIMSQGNLTGPITFPNLNGSLTINNLTIAAIQIKNLFAQAAINLPQASQITITGTKLHLKQHTISSLFLTAAGTLPQHSLNVKVQANIGNLTIHATGGYQQQNWVGTISTLTLVSKQFGLWQLNQPIKITYGNIINVANFCWQSNYSKLCAAASYYSPTNWTAQAFLQHLNLAMLQYFLPNSLQISSDLNGNLNLKANTAGYALGELNLLVNSALIDHRFNNQTQRFNLINSSLKFTLNKQNGLLGKLILQDKAHLIPLTLQVQLPDYTGIGLPAANNKISGSLQASWPSLHFLSTFIPEVDDLDGRLESRLTVSGTLAKPNLQGYIKILNGQLTLKKLNLVLTAIKLSLEGHSNNKINLAGELKSNGKLLRLTGTSSLASGFSPTSFTLQGTDVPIINNQEYKINVSPNLNITYQFPIINITGALHIPYALITPKDFTSTVELPNSVVFVGQEEKSSSSNFKLEPKIKVKVTLGEKIKLIFAGLNANLAGSTEIEVAPNELTTATGMLQVTKGFYEAYGEKLHIKNGTLIYTGGAITNPGINVLATKTIKAYQPDSTTGFSSDSITVGVQVTGTMQRPEVSLYSSPAMSNANILSYLVFGQASDNLSNSEFQVLSKAASALGFTGESGGNLVNNVKDMLGLSELGMESNEVVNPENNQTQENSSFVVGKKLAKNLFVSYSVGFLVPVNILTVRYYLFRHWVLQTDASTYGSGADILYTFESN